MYILTIPAMTCGHCRKTISTAVQAADQQARLDFKPGEHKVMVATSLALAELTTVIAYGITSIRNPAGDPAANAHYDAEIAADRWLGPDAVHAGFTFDPVPIKGGSVYPVGEAAWQAEIKRQKDLGMRYIKLYTGLSLDELKLGNRLAHEQSLETIAHLDLVSWRDAIDVGIDHLTHALPTSADLLPPVVQERYRQSRLAPSAKFMYEWFELVDLQGAPMLDLYAKLKASGMALDLTLSVHEVMFYFDQIDTLLAPDYADTVHPAILDQSIQALGASHAGWTENDYRDAQKAMAKVLEFTRILHDSGVPLLLGTDSVNGGGIYYRELLLHERAGIETWDVLYLATTGNAQGSGFRNSGRIAAGYEADVVFLDSNPLLDLKAVRDVRGTLHNGTFYSQDSLKAQAAAVVTRKP